MVTRRDLLVGAASAFVAGAVPASARSRRAIALVTADLEAAIVVVDPLALRALRRIPCAPGPRSIERIGRTTALVAHTDEGLVSLIDGRRGRVGAVVRGLREPRYAAATPDGRHVFVTDSAAQTLVTIDVARARVVSRVDVGGPARHLGLQADGRTLWAALGSKARRIAVVDVADPVRPRLRRRLTPPFRVHDVAAVPGGGGFWVTAGDRRAILLYDRAGREPRATLGADAAPQHVAFAGRIAYVASGDDGTLRAHRASDGRRIWTAPIPVGSYNLTTEGRLLVTPSLSRGTLASVRPGARSARSRTFARSAHDVCLLGP